MQLFVLLTHHGSVIEFLQFKTVFRMKRYQGIWYFSQLLPTHFIVFLMNHQSSLIPMNFLAQRLSDRIPTVSDSFQDENCRNKDFDIFKNAYQGIWYFSQLWPTHFIIFFMNHQSSLIPMNFLAQRHVYLKFQQSLVTECEN